MNKQHLTLRYVLWDICTSLIVWYLFMLFRKTVNDGLLFQGLLVMFPNYNFFTSLTVFPFFCISIHALSGYYIQPDTHSILDTFFTTFFTSVCISVIIFFVLLLDDVVVSYHTYYYSLAVLFLLHYLITLISRFYQDIMVRHMYRSKRWTINTLIIGTGKNAQKIASELENYERNTLIGFVSLNQRYSSTVAGSMVLGTMSQIASIISDHKIEEAIIVPENDDEKQLFQIINQLYKYNIHIRFSPRLYEILTGSARIVRPELSPFVNITDIRMSNWEASIKRLLDIVVSFISLTLLAPVLLFFAIKIKRESKGPVFYRQERIGRHGKPFNIIKLRSMYLGSEKGVPQLSSPNDDRITPTGRTLRKYRLDEVPQFWNIMKGDMSLVGPRPERKFYINQIIEEAPYYCLLYKIRPGLTSWGPIKVGYTDSLEKMIERLNYDIIYIDNMSLLNDLKIMIFTLEILFRGKGV